MLSRDGKRAMAYVMPGVLLSALIVVYPLIYIIIMSFSSNGFSMGGFVGFRNYTKLFKNPQFSKAYYYPFLILQFYFSIIHILLIFKTQISIFNTEPWPCRYRIIC